MVRFVAVVQNDVLSPAPPPPPLDLLVSTSRLNWLPFGNGLTIGMLKNRKRIRIDRRKTKQKGKPKRVEKKNVEEKVQRRALAHTHTQHKHVDFWRNREKCQSKSIKFYSILFDGSVSVCVCVYVYFFLICSNSPWHRCVLLFMETCFRLKQTWLRKIDNFPVFHWLEMVQLLFSFFAPSLRFASHAFPLIFFFIYFSLSHLFLML